MAGLRWVPLAMVAACAAFVMTGASALSACSSSSDSSTPTPGVEAGGPVEGGGGMDSAMATDTSPGKDAAPATENECTMFTDRTAPTASRTIQWDLGVVSIPERCIKIKAGQTVTWGNGADAGADFNEHPLVIYKSGGGTAPTANLTNGEATFAAAGLFGFACGIHGQMRGAVLVE